MKVIIFTDGAARGNPDGPGGYGAIVRILDKNGNILEKELSGGFPKTTNNRMELMAPIAALEELGNLEEPCRGLLYSDSRYLVDAIEKNWIKNWQRNGWVTSSKTPVKNQDLWTRLLKALEPHEIQFRWVKGHADHPENERCDRLATAAADKVGWSLDGKGKPFSQSADWKLLKNSAESTEDTRSAADAESTEDTRSAADAGSAADTRSAENLTSAPAPDPSDPAASAEPGFSSSVRKIKIRYLSDRIEKLQPPSASANWIDLRAAEDAALKKGDFRLIRLGVAMKLPDGYEAHVVPRSSTYKNFGIIQANHHGVIDNSYCGDTDEWMMPVIAMRDTQIHVNDRICQFRIERRQPDIVFEEVDHLDGTDRGGFGSTGIR